MKAHASLVVLALFASTTVAADGDANVGRIFHSTVWTGKEVIVWGGGSNSTFFGHGFRTDPAAKERTVISDKDAPSGRWAHAAVWTGSEMIVWGGRSNFAGNDHHSNGARYDPKTDKWTAMSNEKAPSARSQMAVVWTGDEMIVWGGYNDGSKATNTGGRYNPKTDKWTPLPEKDAPDARVEAACVWTGKEFIVWGGITSDLKRTFHDGARYNPVTDKWSKMKSADAAPQVWGSRAVWTGTEMLIWGGSHRNGDDEINEVINRGAAYDPVKDSWRAISKEKAPTPRFFHTSIWTGTKLIVWGGGDQGVNADGPKFFDDGAEYDPTKDRWTPLTWEKPPVGRGMHSAIWTGKGMMIFGGSTGGSGAFSDATVYEPK